MNKRTPWTMFVDALPVHILFLTVLSVIYYFAGISVLSGLFWYALGAVGGAIFWSWYFNRSERKYRESFDDKYNR